MKKVFCFRIAVIIFMLILISSCGERGKKAPLPKDVEAADVVYGEILKKVLFTGNIVAENAFDVFPRATGKVSKKLLNEGDPVKRNQAILSVSRDEVGYTFRQMPVTSIKDGLVGRIYVDVGSFVDPSKPVATVVSPGSMRVKLDIPERYLGVILPGTQVSLSVDSLNGDSYGGTIITSSPVVDERTRTANVEIEVQNTDGRLRHGMFGRMLLAVDRRENTLYVPINAISWEGEKRFVYKIAGDKVHRTEVKTGLRNDVHVEVLEGVSEGDKLVAGDLIDIKDGEGVKVVNRDSGPGTRDSKNQD